MTMLQATVLDDILSCPTLPSLPAVALKVIELTSDPDCSMDELGSLIQNDQALAAKVLRTVNSSFYGLREPCSTIKRAIVMLGLSPVKALTLGFSLVSAVETEGRDEFPFAEYWRRSLFAAVGAKVVAEAAELPTADEAFLAGLLHDIGMIALYEALREHYVAVIEKTEGEHAMLVRHEIEAFELQHPEIGAMLAERWRIPSQLVMPIRYHERPTAAPSDNIELVHAVALGLMAHDALNKEESRTVTNRFYDKCSQWLRISSEDATSALRRINEGVAEMADLFNLETGEHGNTDDLVARAEERLVEMSRENPRETYATQKLEDLVTGSSETDPLTGLPTREGFEAAFAATFDEAQARREPLTLLQVALDGLGEVNNAAGQFAVDEVIVGTVALLTKHFEPLGGVVCRLGSGVFTVILPGTGRTDAVAAAEKLRTSVTESAPRWLSNASSGSGAPPITVSIGVSSADEETRAAFPSAQRLLLAGAQAVKAARGAGGNCVRAFRPRLAA